MELSPGIEAAKSLGRVHKSGDERRRLLSIVALDFPKSVLQSYFHCSKGTITAARVHVFFSEEVAPHKMASNLPDRL